MPPYLTVFTPTYNRAHTLPRLFASLLSQTCFDFEWVVVDDGSTDGTDALLSSYESSGAPFPIVRRTVPNGGKPRAINCGTSLATGRFFFILDSDDYLLPTAVETLIRWAKEIEDDPSFIGVGTAILTEDGRYLKGVPPKVNELGYVDATNLERAAYDLDADMREAYKLDLLKTIPFLAIEGEKFAPEGITLNKFALRGYRIRWHREGLYIGEYLDDGLTRDGTRLVAANPRGYCAMYLAMLGYPLPLRTRLYAALQAVTLAACAHRLSDLKGSPSPVLLALAFLPGLLLSLRRRAQFQRLCKEHS